MRRTLYNYPEGLPTGEYMFNGHWFGPCFRIAESLEAFGQQPIECDEKNKRVDFPLELLGIPTSVLVIVTG